MRIYDISLPVSNSLVSWPGDPAVSITKTMMLEQGDPATVSKISIGVHTGTHIDAPAHFIQDGAEVESLSLEVLIGKTLVVEMRTVSSITAADLQAMKIPNSTERILFRTTNSDLWKRKHQEFCVDFVAISADGAQWIVENGFKLVGVDYLSVAPFDDPVPTHRILLGNGIVVLEGLDLSAISQGVYELICLPLKLVGAEGAPARAVLLQPENS